MENKPEVLDLFEIKEYINNLIQFISNLKKEIEENDREYAWVMEELSLVEEKYTETHLE